MKPDTFYDNYITQHKSRMFFAIAKEPQPLTMIMIANFQLQTARGDLKKDSSVGRWSSMSLMR